MPDILIVEDDVDAAEALETVMRIEGHEVRVAYNGEQGLIRLRERIPDLLLLDVEMPMLDGPGLANRILIHDAGLECIPIVLFSGVPDLRAIAGQIGTPYFLGKPCTYERLLTVLDTALRERTPPTVTHPRE